MRSETGVASTNDVGKSRGDKRSHPLQDHSDAAPTRALQRHCDNQREGRELLGRGVGWGGEALARDRVPEHWDTTAAALGSGGKWVRRGEREREREGPHTVHMIHAVTHTSC